MFVRLAVINVNYKIISSYKFIWRIGKKKGKRERERRRKKQRENKTWPKIPKRKGKSKKTGLKIKS